MDGRDLVGLPAITMVWEMYHQCTLAIASSFNLFVLNIYLYFRHSIDIFFVAAGPKNQNSYSRSMAQPSYERG